MVPSTSPRWSALVTRMSLMILVCAAGLPSLAPRPASAQAAPAARALVSVVAERMGGESTLRSIRYVELDMMTQWQRTSFRGMPFSDRPSFEHHVDQRDYLIGAWRNRRDFGARTLTNVVTDSVATTDMGDGPQPLSVAYVDERDELFTYTPDRLVLALLDATDLNRTADTLLAGERHHVVEATLTGRYPSRVYLHAGTGLPSLLRFKQGHPNDFGLVQWGDMNVEVWYSNWATLDGVAIPRQWDISRVGAPYKRMTVQRADFSAELPDSLFEISDESRIAYRASDAPRPMHEARGIEAVEQPHRTTVAITPPFGLPAGAVSVPGGWLLIGAGQAESSFERTLDRLGTDGVAPVWGVLVGESRAGNGGVVAAARRGLPILVSPAAAPIVRTILRNHAASDRTVDVVDRVRTLGSGDEELRLAPVDLPDAPGSLLIYKPATGWLYTSESPDPLHHTIARARATELGWAVERIGDPRSFWGEGPQ